ncbi:MAG: hypothetical protein IKO52_08515 [Clostridia bacterium]|nr:hypothetical protein [Clostridia bacterium]
MNASNENTALRVDVEKTKAYYSAFREEDLCDCEGCRYYRAHVRHAFPIIADYFDSLGMDIAKPFHVSYVVLKKENKMLYIACCYVAFGDCGLDFSQTIDGMVLTRAGACPDSGVEEPHIELEIEELTMRYSKEE